MSTRKKASSTRQPPHHGVRSSVVAGPTSYDEVVRLYLDGWKPSLDKELDCYSQQPSLGQAVARAAMALASNNKRHPHQLRLSLDTLREVAAKLNARVFQRQTTFTAIHQSVRDAIADIQGVGELMVYDTALRIGAKRGFLPEFVYLHRGTREGVRALGLDARPAHLPLDAFPTAFAALQPHEVEDCICIFKDELRAIRLAAR